MKLTVNGETREVAAGTIDRLVDELALPPQAVLVEHNGTALHRDEWDSRQLTEGDQLEIVRVVAGG